MTEESLRYIPHNHVALWPDEDTGPFRLRIYWAHINDRVECAGIELTSVRNTDMPVDPIKGGAMEEPSRLSLPGWDANPTILTSSLLRQLNLAGIVEQTKVWTADWQEYFLVNQPERLGEIADRTEYLEQVRRLRAESAPKRRRGYGPEHYAAVARVYEKAHKVSKSPTKAVAEEWMVSKSTAAKWVRKARDLKFLGETQRGKPGGIRPEKEKGNDDE